jgi:hypothetical protein
VACGALCWTPLPTLNQPGWRHSASPPATRPRPRSGIHSAARGRGNAHEGGHDEFHRSQRGVITGKLVPYAQGATFDGGGVAPAPADLGICFRLVISLSPAPVGESSGCGGRAAHAAGESRRKEKQRNPLRRHLTIVSLEITGRLTGHAIFRGPILSETAGFPCPPGRSQTARKNSWPSGRARIVGSNQTFTPASFQVHLERPYSGGRSTPPAQPVSLQRGYGGGCFGRSSRCRS